MTATGEPRVSVNTNPNDPDETDEFPGHTVLVQTDGELCIVDSNELIVERYKPGEWQFVTCVSAEASE